jgi:RNA polymerase sigma-70 factor (ECF subfamily)
MNPSEQNESHSTVDKIRSKDDEMLLVFAACSGDSHAFVELSEPHSKRILLTLYRITRNWQDAEDVLQEALMKAFLHLDSFQGKARFSTWFTSIAVNTALMQLRKRRGDLAITIDTAGDAGTRSEWVVRDSRDNPEQCFVKQQRANLIQLGILRLPPKLRTAAELQHSRDLSNKEIARCLGISLASAKSRLSRARAALRAFVQRKASKPSANATPTGVKQSVLPKSSESDIKISPTRRKRKNCSLNSMEHNFTPVRAVTSNMERYASPWKTRSRVQLEVDE